MKKIIAASLTGIMLLAGCSSEDTPTNAHQNHTEKETGHARKEIFSVDEPIQSVSDSGGITLSEKSHTSHLEWRAEEILSAVLGTHDTSSEKAFQTSIAPYVMKDSQASDMLYQLHQSSAFQTASTSVKSISVLDSSAVAEADIVVSKGFLQKSIQVSMHFAEQDGIFLLEELQSDELQKWKKHNGK